MNDALHFGLVICLATGCASSPARPSAAEVQYRTMMANLSKPVATVPVTRVSVVDAPNKPAPSTTWHCWQGDVVNGPSGASSCRPTRAECNDQRNVALRSVTHQNVSQCAPHTAPACFSSWNEGDKSTARLNCAMDMAECQSRIPRETVAVNAIRVAATDCFAP